MNDARVFDDVYDRHDFVTFNKAITIYTNINFRDRIIIYISSVLYIILFYPPIYFVLLSSSPQKNFTPLFLYQPHQKIPLLDAFYSGSLFI